MYSTFARRFHMSSARHALTAAQMAAVKATAPILQQRGTDITKHFYKRMFARHPELNNVFNQAHQKSGQQPLALANAVFAYAANIDNLGVLGGAVAKMAHKHASLQIKPEQYPIVGENLLASVVEVLGPLPQETLEAWKAAYDQLAQILINAEAALYAETAAKKGGWNGWRGFKIARKVQESDEITSFYLQPTDGGAVCDYKPGQFISVKLFVPEIGYDQPRQYSLSDASNGKEFRISVKRENDGKVSNALHQMSEGATIDVSAPYGDFFIDPMGKTPVVFISGGVGLTPMMSMLNTIVEQNPSRPIHFIHGCRSGPVHAFTKYLQSLTKEHNNVQKTVFYEHVHAGDKQGEHYDMTGQIDLLALKPKITQPGTEYFVCGPVRMMDTMTNELKSFGVPPERIHSEMFGSELSRL